MKTAIDLEAITIDGGKLRAAREARNLSIAEFAALVTLSREQVKAIEDGGWDALVIDTAPSRNALDFLDAPGTLSRFLDHPVFKLMMLPARRGLKVLNLASQPLLRAIGKVV